MRRAALAVLVVVIASPTLARADDEDKVSVTIDADDYRVVIERRANVVEGWQTTLGIPIFTATSQWEPVCVPPCKIQMSPHGVYRASGRGVADSREIVLPKGDDLHLTVDARSAFWHGTGVGLTVLGGLLAAVGSVSTGVAGNITATDAEDRVRGFGVSLLVAGGVMLAAGIPLWITQTSSIRAEPRKPP